MAAKMDVMVVWSAVMLVFLCAQVITMEKLLVVKTVVTSVVLMAVRMDASQAAARVVA